MDLPENDGDLIGYLEILWKRRWLIIVPAALIALIAGVIGFLIPPRWEIDAIIQPSKFFVQSEAGTFTEVVVMDPKQLAGQINQGSYNREIAAGLHVPPRNFARLKAEHLKDTKLVRVSLQTPRPEKDLPVLGALFERIKSELDRKIDVEIKSITTQITSKESDIKARGFDIQAKNIEIGTLKQEIVSAGNKLKISEDRSSGLVAEMKNVKARIEEIEKQQRSLLAEKRSGTEALGLLLYANEVQQNVRYANTLEESLSAEKNTREDLKLSLRSKEQAIQGIKTEIEKISQEIVGLRSDIELLEEKKQRIDYAQMVKEPTVSSTPVSPKKAAIVAASGVSAFFAFALLALLVEAVEKRRSRLGPRP